MGGDLTRDTQRVFLSVEKCIIAGFANLGLKTHGSNFQAPQERGGFEVR